MERRPKRAEIAVYAYSHVGFFWLDDSKVVSSNDKIAWKGGYFYLKDDKTGKMVTYPVLIKLLIPKDAYRTHYRDKEFEQYGKHRCSYAKVLGFYSYYNGKELTKYDNETAHAIFNHAPLYKKGWEIKPDGYDTTSNVCGRGIHFFWDKTSALMYLDNSIEVPSYKRKNAYI